jgi:hypothetical protein
MKTILAATWNALIDRLRREQILGCTVLEHGGWKHPWQVTPSWNFEREEWVCEIHPGFVNGLDAEVRLDAKEAPLETVARLGAKNGERVDAWLTEGPQMPLRQWRAIGADASPESVSVSGFETIVESYEPVPEFFVALGAGAAEEGGRLLRATEIVLQQDRLTTGTDWTFGAGVDGTIAQFNVTYRLPPGSRERAYLRTTSRYEPPTAPDPMDRLMGRWEDEGFDALHLATVFLLAPEDMPAGSEPGPDWTPDVKHRVFWNLVHAVRFDPPVGRTENITLFTGLAGGVADGIINQMLAENNDASAAASEFLANRTVEGRFWSI